MKRIIWLVLATSAPAACGTPASHAPTPSRAAVIDCGTFTLNQGEQMPDAAVRCLIQAAGAGRPARLSVTRPTTEGDPIPVTYTAQADGRVEVVTDSREDKFGSRKITHEICTSPTPTEFGVDFAQCSPSS